MDQVERAFLVTVRLPSAYGDTSYPILITKDFADALGVLKRLDELGYRRQFCTNAHGVIIYGMDLGQSYAGSEYAYITGLPVTNKTFPPMVLFVWNPEKNDLRVEWFPTAFRRMGVTLPPDLLAGAVSLEG